MTPRGFAVPGRPQGFKRSCRADLGRRDRSDAVLPWGPLEVNTNELRVVILAITPYRTRGKGAGGSCFSKLEISGQLDLCPGSAPENRRNKHPRNCFVYPTHRYSGANSKVSKKLKVNLRFRTYSPGWLNKGFDLDLVPRSYMS